MKNTTANIFEQELIDSLPDGTMFIARSTRSETKKFLNFYQTDLDKIQAFLSSMPFKFMGEGRSRCGSDYEFYFLEGGTQIMFLEVCFSCNKAYIEIDGFEISREIIMRLLYEFCNSMPTEGERYIETLKKYADREL